MNTGKRTPEARAKMSAMMAAFRADPAFNAKAKAVRAEALKWPAERVERLRAIMRAGASIADASKELQAGRQTIIREMKANGIALGNPDAPIKQAALEAALRAHYPTTMLMGDVILICAEATGREMTLRQVQYEAMKLRLLRPMAKAAPCGLSTPWRGGDQPKPVEPKGLGFAGRRAAKAVQMQAAIDAGQAVNEARRMLRIGSTCWRTMKLEGSVIVPPRPILVKAPKPPREPKGKTLPRERKPPPTVIFGAKAIRRPAIGRVQTVEEFLASGGKVTACPAVAVAWTTATITEADRAAAAAHTMARGGYGFTDTWQAINKRTKNAHKKAKAEAAANAQTGHVEQDRIAA